MDETVLKNDGSVVRGKVGSVSAESPLRLEYYKIIDRNKVKTFANISVAKNNFGSTGQIELATEIDKLLFKNK